MKLARGTIAVNRTIHVDTRKALVILGKAPTILPLAHIINANLLFFVLAGALWAMTSTNGERVAIDIIR